MEVSISRESTNRFRATRLPPSARVSVPWSTWNTLIRSRSPGRSRPRRTRRLNSLSVADFTISSVWESSDAGKETSNRTWSRPRFRRDREPPSLLFSVHKHQQQLLHPVVNFTAYLTVHCIWNCSYNDASPLNATCTIKIAFQSKGDPPRTEYI